MMRIETVIGIISGLLLSGAVVLCSPGEMSHSVPEGSVLLADQRGRIEEVVIHYTTGAFKIVAPTYSEFFKNFDQNTKVHLIVTDQKALAEFEQQISYGSVAIEPHIAGHAMTTWSRDRWVLLEHEKKNILLHSRAELLAESWPARAGDQQIADDLAENIAGLKAIRSFLYFDGGDFVSDSETVFASPNILQRNLQLTVGSALELEQRLRALFSKKVVLLEQAPLHHAGMFMMPIGNRTVLVSDPAWGLELAGSNGKLDSAFEGGLDTSASTQHLYDSVAERCRSIGYTVIRIPSLHGSDQRAFITYVNGILDFRKGARIAYVPSYKDFPELNTAAAQVWEKAGYQPVMIDATATYRQGGTLRCLVNPLKRSSNYLN